LVTRSQPVSITDTYATLKTAALQMALPGVGVVCNQSGVDCADDGQTHAAATRIASAADRFLNLSVDVLAAIPHAGELAGETAATSRLHKDAALRSAFTKISESVWQRIHSPSPMQSGRRAAA
jgi:MinD-like ATPase involved in chromosome partitioning or flagellar assembly